MEVIDYNGVGRWSRESILDRYAVFARQMKLVPRDLTPNTLLVGERTWIYPVMQNVIDGIESDDAACVRLGIEFIEEDALFPFGKVLKSNTARALRRATLTDGQKYQIRRRVFGMLEKGQTPKEFRDYAKLVRRIGFALTDVPHPPAEYPYAARFRAYFEYASHQDAE